MENAFDLVRPLEPDHSPEQRERASLAARALFQRNLEEAASTPRPFDLKESAARYQLDDGFADAINMALCVEAPLLVTGEPGTGKTQVAYHLAWYLGLEIFRYQARSTSTATDLKYDFDAVAYLRSAQSGSKDTRERTEFLHPRPLWLAYEAAPSVLLIDEIDKAPRDFPNDLLQELAEHGFQHPFDPKLTVRSKSGRPPIVIATSNAERRLPDAFLRRCIVHHIELDARLIRRIVAARRSDLRNLDDATRDRAIERFLEIREQPGLSRKPATSELLTWLALLSAKGLKKKDIDVELRKLPGIAALIKVPRDLDELAR